MFQSINDLYSSPYVCFAFLIAEHQNLKCLIGARVSGLGQTNTIIPQFIIPCPSNWRCANLHLYMKTESLPFNLNLLFPGKEHFIFESQHCVPPMNCSDICRIAGSVLSSEVLKCEHRCCSDDLCNADWRFASE